MKPDPGAPLGASQIAPPRSLGASTIAPPRGFGASTIAPPQDIVHLEMPHLLKKINFLIFGKISFKISTFYISRNAINSYEHREF